MAEAVGQTALLRLMTWLSPAFPVGAFAYSHGLERAIHDAVIVDRQSLVGWLTDLVERGSGWNDAVLLAETWRRVAAGEGCEEVLELAGAMAGSRERHMETTLQGEAFSNAVESWEVSRPTLPPSVLPDISPTRGEIAPTASVSPIASVDRGAAPTKLPISPLVGEMSGRTEGSNVEWQVGPQRQNNRLTYPVAVARTAALQGIPLEATLAAYLHAFTSNLIQAAVRLVPLGQRDGVATMAAMEPVILAVAARAAMSSLDDLGSATFLSEIAAMKHEVQYSRVFRS